MAYLWTRGLKKLRLYKDGSSSKPLCFHCAERAVLSVLDNYGWVHCCLVLALEVLTKNIERRNENNK